jgi:hypothetical protein
MDQDQEPGAPGDRAGNVDRLEQAGATMVRVQHEKPQKGNPNQLTQNQHTFPKKSIARFVGPDGRVHIHMKPNDLIPRLKPSNTIFCAQRVWDHPSEMGFMKKIEDDFQCLARFIMDGQVSDFNQGQTDVISSFYALWMAREQIRTQPERDDIILRGILPGRPLSKDEEEKREKAGRLFLRGNTVPARVMNGVSVRAQVVRNLREIKPTACWGIVRALDGEFVVPDWPAYAFVPIHPTLALTNPPIDRSINRDGVGVINNQLRLVSRRYFFARDFAACP